MKKVYRRTLTLLAGVLLLAATTAATVAAHYAHDQTESAAFASTGRTGVVESVVDDVAPCRGPARSEQAPAALPPQGRQA